MNRVLITGGAGYIGSHVAYELLALGRQVVILDNLSTGCLSLVPKEAVFVRGNIADERKVKDILREHNVDSVLHFAGSIVVEESVRDPIKYYSNNTCGSLSLIKACSDMGITKLIFSSTAAVYGALEVDRASETTRLNPISPYGWSKAMTELALEHYSASNPSFRSVRLRYFNVGGADPHGRTGQLGQGATHLIKVALDVALGRRAQLEIFGTDYSTRDGTCERDFIHVTDLARAHVAALNYLEEGGPSDVFNCGYGKGVTVKEVIEAIEEVTGEPLRTVSADRRPGDPARVVADSTKLRSQMNWEPEYEDVREIVGSALAWQQRSV